MISMRTVPVLVESLVARTIGEETVILNQSGDKLHTLNETGSFIWSLIDGRRSLGDIYARMKDEYDLPADGAESELKAFVRELAERGIVRIGD